MVIVRQTTHGAYILAEMDSAVSKLRFAAFRVISYHARQRMNIDLETFFVFPDADEEMEDAEDEMETDEEIQETAGYLLMMKRITHHEYRPPPRYRRQTHGFRRIPAAPKRHTENTVRLHYIPFHFSVLLLHLSLHFISPFLYSTKPQLSCVGPPWVSRP
jgi:hypothetical protein